MGVFDVRVKFNYWEFIIKQDIYVKKTSVKKEIFNLLFLRIKCNQNTIGTETRTVTTVYP